MGLLSPSADPPEGGRSPAPPGPILPSPDPFRPAGVGFVVSFPAQVHPICSFRSGFLSVTPENGDIGFPYVAPTSGGGGGRDIRYPVGYRTLGVIRNRGTPFLYPLMAPLPFHSPTEYPRTHTFSIRKGYGRFRFDEKTQPGVRPLPPPPAPLQHPFLTTSAPYQ